MFEVLEPRIMLSADGLLNSILPDQDQDTSLESTQEIIQYAELLEKQEHIEEQVISDTSNNDNYRPILTLSIDDNEANVESDDADLSVDNVSSTQVNNEIAVHSDDFDGDIENKVGTPEDEGPQVHVNDAKISIEENTSIEIRGPPASESVNVGSEELEVDLSILSEYAGELQPDGTVDLPGLYLVDPTVDYFDGQIIYLDFDGEQDVTYNGPVLVDGINIPEFSADSAGLADQEAVIMSQILTALEQEFDGTGVQFTTTKPDPSTSYSTIFVGGYGVEFGDYGLFVGLAEKIDVGNQDPSDNAFVFSENIVSDGADLSSVVAVLTDVIAHETRHLLGYAHEIESDGGGPLDAVADLGEYNRTDDVSIYDNSTVDYDVYVSIPSGMQITDLVYRTWISHTYPGDLDISLISPDGTSYKIWNNHGGTDDGGYDDDSASDEDIYLNRRSTSAFDGEDPRGWWTMRVRDEAGGDEGYISYLELDVYYSSPQPFEPEFWSANLTGVTDNNNNSKYSSLNVGFDVDSNVAGQFYVEIYDNDPVFDDLITTSPMYSVSGNTSDWHYVAFDVASWWFEWLDTADIYLELHDAATGALKDTYNLGTIAAELPEDDVLFIPYS